MYTLPNTELDSDLKVILVPNFKLNEVELKNQESILIKFNSISLSWLVGPFGLFSLSSEFLTPLMTCQCVVVGFSCYNNMLSEAGLTPSQQGQDRLAQVR